MKRRRVALVLWLVGGGALGCARPAPAEDPDAFTQRLGAITGQWMRGAVALEKVEEEYLDVLRLPLSPEQCGVVFSQMGSMYASQGGREYCDTTATYCQEALSYPLAPDVAGDVYVCWSAALRDHYLGWRGVRFPVARRRIMQPVLTGLSVVMDAGAPSQAPTLPAVGMMSGAGPPPPGLEKRHAEEVAARKKAESLSRLFEQRRALVGTCAWLYRQPPADPDELQRLLTQALPKYPDVVEQIMGGLKAGK